jgi:tetratricopeptide (TPR) repeat protein
MSVRFVLTFSSLICIQAPALSAQRPDYAALRDSLSAITDVPLLYRMERSVPPAGTAATVEPVVRRGLVALRIWELTRDRDDANRSRDVFETATERFPGQVWSHYGLALALAYGPEIGLSLPGNVLGSVTIGQSIGEILGRDPRSNARRSLRRALELDPAFGEAAVLLADLAVMDGGRKRELIEEARDALRSVRAAGGSDAGTARALAEMEMALGNFAEAGAVTEGAVSANAEDAGVLRTRAMALLLQPGSAEAGAAAYWRGVERLNDDGAGQYYTDLEVLATPAEAAEWRNADLEGRRMWLRRFWELRAAGGGVTAAERLAEHYRRLTAARTRYVRNSGRGTDGVGVLLDGEEQHDFPFDDRGIVLIRHGEPRSIVRTGTRGTLPNESWFYDLPGQGEQLFHFVARRGTQNFSLARDLLQALDPERGVDASTRATAVLGLISDRAPYEQRYQAIIPRLTRLLQAAPTIDISGTEVRSLLELADAEYRPGARAAMRTDTHVRTYTGDLPYHHDVFTFRTPESRTDLTAAFAIPAGGVDARSIAGGVEYAVRLSVIVTDTLFDVVTRRDTVHRFRFARRLADSEFLRTNLSLPVQPSDDAIYRLVVADSASGRGRLETGSSDVRDYADAGLMVSDIVLAHPDSVGDWRRGDATFALALPRVFERERPFTVYYEVYNLHADRSYSTRIVVEPAGRRGFLSRLGRLFGGGGAIINVRFDDVAAPTADGVVAESRELASDLAAGTYRMTVTVTTPDGGRAVTESTFVVDG